MKRVIVRLVETRASTNKNYVLASSSIYDKKFSALHKKLVPASGKAKTAEGGKINQSLW